MDPNLRIAQVFRIEHRHRDGSWNALEPIHHDSAAHDGERSWIRHGETTLRCPRCDETITVTVEGEDDATPEHG